MSRMIEIVKECIGFEQKLDELKKSYEKQSKVLNEKINQCRKEEFIISTGYDLDKINLAKKCLCVEGNPYGITQGMAGEPIAACAIKDIINGCPHLKEGYFGNKKYCSFYQRCDCSYSYGPTYGTIVDYIGLRDRTRGLTEEESEAAVYYLSVWRTLKAKGID